MIAEAWEVLSRLRQSPEIFSRLAELREKKLSELAVQTALRKEFDERLVREAITQSGLREKATAKFSRAAEMWFDRVALEQATSEAVSRYKATRFADFSDVWDCCSGIGGDAIALSRDRSVTLVDQDAVRLLKANWNLGAYGFLQPQVCARVEDLMLAGQVVHIDPDRRNQLGERSLRLEHANPGLGWLQQLTKDAAGGAIKLGPACNFGGKFPGCEIELISLNGECKEAVVWFGDLAGGPPSRATVLPGEESIEGDPLDCYPKVGSPGEYLFDPDPAVVRAGLVDRLCELEQLRRIDDAEEYLTGDETVATPFATAFRIEAALPNNLKDLRKYFRSRGEGAAEIKCRHLSIDTSAVQKQLPNGNVSVFFARVAGKSRIFITRRL